MRIRNPDPACHFDADPDPGCHFDADPDPGCHFNADPACHFDADPDPGYHFDADPDPDPTFHLKKCSNKLIFHTGTFRLVICKLMRIWIRIELSL